MRLNSLLVYIFLLITNSLQAQVIQKGKVVEQNSGLKGIPQVTIMVIGAAPANSDNNGAFSITLPKGKEGGRVLVADIGKAGYEIVNRTEINEWNLSSSHPFNIVMCKQGTLEEARRKYYKIGVDVYRTRYQKKLEELQQSLQQDKLNKEIYEEKLSIANEELQQAMDKLEMFADKFARINRDELNELDKKAFALLDRGDIEGAIKVYEEAQILEQFKEKMAVRDSVRNYKEAIRPLLEKEKDWLINEGGETNRHKADSINNALKETK